MARGNTDKKKKNRSTARWKNLPIIRKVARIPHEPAREFHGISSQRRKAPFMFYPVRALFRRIALVHHSEIETLGSENIPPDGAVLLTGNHPNSFMDFFNLVTAVRHPVATAAKDTLLRVPFFGPIVKRWGLFVPMARKIDYSGDEMKEEIRREANIQALKNSVDMISSGRIYNIYVEGRSSGNRRLDKIKLGFMQMVIEAEKEFNFNLNLKIVPYGYYYDQINKFRSRVCVIFGKPFRLKDLFDFPEDFLSLPPAEKARIEKKLLIAGRDRVRDSIEDIIISIRRPELVDLIDNANAVYVLSPNKFSNEIGNIREKYARAKEVADALQIAEESREGHLELLKLRSLIKEYRDALEYSGYSDAVVRRIFDWNGFSETVSSFIKGVLWLPVILFSFAGNAIIYVVSQYRRHKKVARAKAVDGDETAVLTGVFAALFTYTAYFIALSIWLSISGFSLLSSALDFEITSQINNSVILKVITSIVIATIPVYFFGRTWRFALKRYENLKSSFFWLRDITRAYIAGSKIILLKEKRYRVIDQIDRIVNRYL